MSEINIGTYLGSAFVGEESRPGAVGRWGRAYPAALGGKATGLHALL